MMYKSEYSEKRSLYLTFYSTILKNLPEIRSINILSYLANHSNELLNHQTKAEFIISNLELWFKIRIIWLNIFLIQIPSFLIVTYHVYSNYLGEDYQIATCCIYILFCSRDSLNTVECLTQLIKHMSAINKCVMLRTLEPEAQYFDYLEYEKNILKKNTKLCLEDENVYLEEIFNKGFDKN